MVRRRLPQPLSEATPSSFLFLCVPAACLLCIGPHLPPTISCAPVSCFIFVLDAFLTPTVLLPCPHASEERASRSARVDLRPGRGHAEDHRRCGQRDRPPGAGCPSGLHRARAPRAGARLHLPDERDHQPGAPRALGRAHRRCRAAPSPPQLDLPATFWADLDDQLKDIVSLRTRCPPSKSCPPTAREDSDTASALIQYCSRDSTASATAWRAMPRELARAWMWSARVLSYGAKRQCSTSSEGFRSGHDVLYA
jgi:hypothetical protein